MAAALSPAPSKLPQSLPVVGAGGQRRGALSRHDMSLGCCLKGFRPRYAWRPTDAAGQYRYRDLDASERRGDLRSFTRHYYGVPRGQKKAASTWACIRLCMERRLRYIDQEGNNLDADCQSSSNAKVGSFSTTVHMIVGPRLPERRALSPCTALNCTHPGSLQSQPGVRPSKGDACSCEGATAFLHAENRGPDVADCAGEGSAADRGSG